VLGPDGLDDDVEIRVNDLLSLSGVVVDSGGTVMRGRQVRISPADDEGGRSTYTYTDQDGRFAFHLLPPGEYALAVWRKEKEGRYAAGRSDIRLVWDGADTKWNLIEVIVLDPAGKVVPRGTVWIRSGRMHDGRRSSGSGTRAGGGRFFARIEAKVRDFDVDVQSAADAAGRPLNLRPVRRNNLTPEDSPIEIRLEAGIEIEGRVVDREGRGVADVPWNVGSKESLQRPHFVRSTARSGRTDAAGRFQVAGLGTETLYATATPPAPWVQPKAVEVDGGRAIVITLDRGLQVGGRVLDSEGAGLPARVNARLAKASRAQWEDDDRALAPEFVRRGWSAQADASGRFVLEGVPAGAALLITARPTAPHLPVSVDDVQAGADDVELRVSSGVFIEGEIEWNGWEPFGSMSLRVLPLGGDVRKAGRGPARLQVPSTQTSFRLGPLKAGRYTLVAGRHVFDEAVRLDVDAPTANARIELPKSPHLFGVLLGRDVGRFTLRFDHAGGTVGTVMSGPSGAFAILNREDVTGTLVAYRDGDARYARIEGVRPAAGPVRVQLVKGSSISGRITGLPSFDAGWLEIHAVAPMLGISAKVATDGSFRIVGLPPGTYEIDCDWRGQEGRVIPASNVKAGTRDVVLRFEPR